MNRGGKVAMSVALDPSLPDGLLSHLIVGDISPIRGRISKEFQRYVDGMLKVQEEGIRTRKDAFERLSEFEKVIDVLSRYRFIAQVCGLLGRHRTAISVNEPSHYPSTTASQVSYSTTTHK